jgi:hypothetical protein
MSPYTLMLAIGISGKTAPITVLDEDSIEVIKRRIDRLRHRKISSHKFTRIVRSDASDIRR